VVNENKTPISNILSASSALIRALFSKKMAWPRRCELCSRVCPEKRYAGILAGQPDVGVIMLTMLEDDDISNIINKLQVADRAQVIVKARNAGLEHAA
jgi:hypothetical protein